MKAVNGRATHRLLNGVWVDSVAKDNVFVSGGAHQHGAGSVHPGVASVIEANLSAL